MKLRLYQEPPHSLEIIEDGRIIFDMSLPSVDSLDRLIECFKTNVGELNDDGDWLILKATPEDHADVAAEDEVEDQDDVYDEIPRFWNSCGNALFILGRTDIAFDCYQNALNLKDADPVSMLSSSWLRTMQHWIKWEAEKRDVRSFEIQAVDDYDEGHYRIALFCLLVGRGEFRLNIGDFAAAVLDFGSALAICPDRLKDVKAAASAWAAAGLRKQAGVLEQIWKSNLASNPSDQT
jgi:tetratricopeptide (TPR) repeat protein